MAQPVLQPTLIALLVAVVGAGLVALLVISAFGSWMGKARNRTLRPRLPRWHERSLFRFAAAASIAAIALEIALASYAARTANPARDKPVQCAIANPEDDQLQRKANEALEKRPFFCAKKFKPVRLGTCLDTTRTVCAQWDSLAAEVHALCSSNAWRAARERREELTERLTRMQVFYVAPAGDDVGTRVAGIVTFILMNLGAGLLLKHHMQSVGIDLEGPLAGHLPLPFLLTVVIGAWFSVANTAPINYWPGAVAESLEWSSLCFDGIAWSMDRALRVALLASHGYAMSLLWVLGSPDNRPPPMVASHPDGHWGQRRFINMLVTWALAASLFMVIPAFGWAAFLARESTASARFALTWFGLLFVACFAILRLAAQLFRIRRNYEAVLPRLTAEQRAAAPSDPTEPVLGGLGFRLLQTVLLVLGLLWAVIEWSGASRALPLN